MLQMMDMLFGGRLAGSPLFCVHDAVGKNFQEKAPLSGLLDDFNESGCKVGSPPRMPRTLSPEAARKSIVFRDLVLIHLDVLLLLFQSLQTALGKAEAAVTVA